MAICSRRPNFDPHRPHYLADLSVERHVASGRSGGSCDLWEGEGE